MQHRGGPPDKKSVEHDTSKYKNVTWDDYWGAKLAAVKAWKVAKRLSDLLDAEEQSAGQSADFLPGGPECRHSEAQSISA